MAKAKRKNRRFSLAHTRKIRRTLLGKVPLRNRQEKSRRNYASWLTNFNSLPVAARPFYFGNHSSYPARLLGPKSKKRICQQGFYFSLFGFCSLHSCACSYRWFIYPALRYPLLDILPVLLLCLPCSSTFSCCFPIDFTACFPLKFRLHVFPHFLC